MWNKVFVCFCLIMVIFFLAGFYPQKVEVEKIETGFSDALIVRLLLEGKGLRPEQVVWITQEGPAAETRLRVVASELGIDPEEIRNLGEFLFVRSIKTFEKKFDDTKTFQVKTAQR